MLTQDQVKALISRGSGTGGCKSPEKPVLSWCETDYSLGCYVFWQKSEGAGGPTKGTPCPLPDHCYYRSIGRHDYCTTATVVK